MQVVKSFKCINEKSKLANLKAIHIENYKIFKRKIFPHRLRRLTRALVTGLMMGAALFSASAYAQVSGGSTLSQLVKLPNNEYKESTIDLRVKVLGGEVNIERTWTNGRWYLNPAWSNLRFVADPLDDSVKMIDRAGTRYERSGQAGLYTMELGYIRKVDGDTPGWRWYDKLGNWITYDQAGHVTAYGDKNGVEVHFILDAEGRLIEVQDHHKKMVYTFVYDDQEHLTQITDRAGRTVNYTWQGDLLTQVTDVLGYVWLYGYNNDRQIIERTEPDGGKVRIDYLSSVPAPKPAMMSGKGSGVIEHSSVVTTGSRNADTQVARVGKITEKTGAVTLYQLDYDRVNQKYTTTVESPLGKKTIGVYDKGGRLINQGVNNEEKIKFVRDGDYRTKITNGKGFTKTLERDANGNAIKLTRPDGKVEAYRYDSKLDKPLESVDAMGVVTTWQYDANGNVLQYVEAQGTPEAKQVKFSYDIYGQPLQIMTSNANSPEAEHDILQIAYDENGNVKQLTDNDKNIMQVTYNVQGQKLSTTNALGQSLIQTYDAAGYVTSSSDVLGNTWQFASDAFGRIVKVVDPNGNQTEYSYSFQNDPNASWIKVQTNALGDKTIYQYDAENKLVKTIFPSGDIEKRTYDLDGQLASIIDAAGNVKTFQYSAESDSLDSMLTTVVYPTYQEHYKYNHLGLKTQVTQTVDEKTTLTTHLAYDEMGQLISKTNAVDQTTQYQYDALGRIVKQVDPQGNKTTITYNIMGLITGVQDAQGNTYRFEYDKSGNRVKDIWPSGKVKTYAYNEAKQIVQITDAEGKIRHYAYDKSGRITQVSFTDADEKEPQQVFQYAYDAAGNIKEIIQSGSVNTHLVYEYDAIGRVIKESVTYNNGQADAFVKNLQYVYDVDGRLATLIYPDGHEQHYAYKNGLLQTVILPNGQAMHWNGYEWQRPTEIQGPATTTKFTYDALQRQQGIDVKAINSSIIQRGYVYDKAGNVVEQSTDDGIYHYSYDAMGRLTKAEPPETLQKDGALSLQMFSYDTLGNRVGSAQEAGGWVYDEDNQLLRYGVGDEAVEFTYTSNGHVATQTRAGKKRTYTYDASDRLVRVAEDGAELARYSYDPLGRRISKTVAGETTYFLYAKEGLVAELNQEGEMTKAYGWQADTSYSTSPLWQAQSGVQGTVIEDLSQAQFHNLVSDYLGTPLLAVNAQGQVSWSAKTEAFGKTKLDEKNQITMNLRSPGQYYDVETDTHYNYFRNYDPVLGRYIQKDPIGLRGGINTYAYVGNSPLNAIDPLGLLECGCSCPKGNWFVANVGGEAQAFIAKGSANYQVFRCRSDARVKVKAVQICFSVATPSTGIKGSVSAGYQGDKDDRDDPSNPGRKTNPCDLGGWGDWQFSADAGPLSFSDSGVSLTMSTTGVTLLPSASVGKCYTQILEVICDDCVEDEDEDEQFRY